MNKNIIDKQVHPSINIHFQNVNKLKNKSSWQKFPVFAIAKPVFTSQISFYLGSLGKSMGMVFLFVGLGSRKEPWKMAAKAILISC